jgi:hypothetical protein
MRGLPFNRLYTRSSSDVCGPVSNINDRSGQRPAAASFVYLQRVYSVRYDLGALHCGV